MNRALIGSSLVVWPALVLSGIEPYHRMTWWLEVAPVLAVFPLLYFTARRYPLTPLLYWLIAAACINPDPRLALQLCACATGFLGAGRLRPGAQPL